MRAQADDAERLRLLYELGCAFAARVDLHELSAEVVARCREVLHAEAASILLLDAPRQELYFPYVADEDPAVATRLLSLRFPADRGIAGAVLRSGRSVRVDDVANDPRFYGDVDRRTGLITRTLLCAPLHTHQGTIGVIQVLNRRDGEVFADDDLAFLDALAGSIAVAIENARLYAALSASAAQLAEYNRTLEQRVEARTHELREKNAELERTLTQLKETQQQLIVQEKLASLGALTAGVAHEIKNPLNFVTNFAQLTDELAGELRDSLETHRATLGADEFQNIDEVVADVQLNVRKIGEHAGRADRIVRGMLQHSHAKSGDRETVELNALLSEYVSLAYHGMRGQDATFNLTLHTDYDPAVGQVTVVPQDIGRAILNIVQNACYALREKQTQLGNGFVPTLHVRTTRLGGAVEIRIRDNGNGIPPEVREQIFNPFFTTKPPGAGTGLGLSITYDIIVQEHQGQLQVETAAGAYTEFIIVLPAGAA